MQASRATMTRIVLHICARHFDRRSKRIGKLSLIPLAIDNAVTTTTGHIVSFAIAANALVGNEAAVGRDSEIPIPQPIEELLTGICVRVGGDVFHEQYERPPVTNARVLYATNDLLSDG